jgi:hypothetical protein
VSGAPSAAGVPGQDGSGQDAKAQETKVGVEEEGEVMRADTT